MSQAVHQALLQQASALPYLQQLLQANGIQQLSLQGEENFFPYLARSVAGQQLSNTSVERQNQNDLWCERGAGAESHCS